MTFDQLAFLCDENIHPGVIAHLRGGGRDVVSVLDLGLRGASDEVIMQAGLHAGRVIVTHDADFGLLVIALGKPVHAIVYLRPGHVRSEFTIQTIEALSSTDLDLRAPFLLVAHRRGKTVRIRVRVLPVK